MEKTKKITKRERFIEARAIFVEMGREDLVEFVDHEIELLDKKHGKGSTSKTQKENEVVKDVLMSELSHINRAVTVTELMQESDNIKGFILENGLPLSNQKISSLLNQMAKDENCSVVRDEVKGKALFSIRA